MHPIQTFTALSLAVMLPALILASCSSQKVGQTSSETEELDSLEAHYNANVRKVVERDHFEVMDSPEMVPAGAATSLLDDEDVLGVSLGGVAKAYPIGALGRSELINADCGGRAIAASW